MTFLRTLLNRSGDAAEKSELYAQVRDAMSDVQAYARSHGGRIHLVEVTEEGEVKIRMTGACSGCPMSSVTLKLGIEAQLRTIVPGVSRVTQVG